MSSENFGLIFSLTTGWSFLRTKLKKPLSRWITFVVLDGNWLASEVIQLPIFWHSGRNATFKVEKGRANVLKLYITSVNLRFRATGYLWQAHGMLEAATCKWSSARLAPHHFEPRIVFTLASPLQKKVDTLLISLVTLWVLQYRMPQIVLESPNVRPPGNLVRSSQRTCFHLREYIAYSSRNLEVNGMDWWFDHGVCREQYSVQPSLWLNPFSFTRNITYHSMKDLTFHSLFRWKMTYYQFSLTRLYISLYPFTHAQVQKIHSHNILKKTYEACEVVIIGSIIISHLSKLWKAKFFICCFW